MAQVEKVSGARCWVPGAGEDLQDPAARTHGGFHVAREETGNDREESGGESAEPEPLQCSAN